MEISQYVVEPYNSVQKLDGLNPITNNNQIKIRWRPSIREANEIHINPVNGFIN